MEAAESNPRKVPVEWAYRPLSLPRRGDAMLSRAATD